MGNGEHDLRYDPNVSVRGTIPADVAEEPIVSQDVLGQFLGDRVDSRSTRWEIVADQTEVVEGSGAAEEPFVVGRKLTIEIGGEGLEEGGDVRRILGDDRGESMVG